MNIVDALFSKAILGGEGGGGGGSSNFITGTFTTPSTTGANEIILPYTGSSYPIMVAVCIEGGPYAQGSAWYDLVQQNAVGFWAMTKSDYSTVPTYATSGTNNAGTIIVIYKSSSATSYGRGYQMDANSYAPSTTVSYQKCVVVTSNNSLKYQVHNTSYGLAPNMTYRYFIAYK